MLLLVPIDILPQTELGALLAMSEKYEPQRPPILPPDVKIYYEEEDGIKYAYAYWDYQKRRIPVRDHDEDNLKTLLFFEMFDYENIRISVRDNPPTVIAEEI